MDDLFSLAQSRIPLSLEEQQAEDTVAAGSYPLSDRVGGQQTVDAYRMDRYPVTVQRYRIFVDADGYEDPHLWDDDGWLWRLQHQISGPRWWGAPWSPSEETALPPPDPQNTEPTEAEWRRVLSADRPVIGVSWYEARAFCRFVARRLPTQAQWEAAARGPEGLLYPWGQKWQDGRVGNRDVGPRITWPVGFFSEAAGPFGHHDLVGNVWQWTDDPWPTATSESMAVRGGAWSARAEHCRTDHANAYSKDGRWSHVGFRTVAL